MKKPDIQDYVDIDQAEDQQKEKRSIIDSHINTLDPNAFGNLGERLMQEDEIENKTQQIL